MTPHHTCEETVARTLATGEHLSDVLMPSGQVLRGLGVDATVRMLNQGGICLPRLRPDRPLEKAENWRRAA